MYNGADGYKYWGTDFEDGSGGTPMDVTLSGVLQRYTNAVVGSPVRIRPSSKAIFRFPLVYAVEAEQIAFNEQEIANMHEYLLRGGILVLDDFHGPSEFEHVMDQVFKILPEGDVKKVDPTHELFRVFFTIPAIVQVPVVDQGRTCYVEPFNCVTSEEGGVTPEVWIVSLNGHPSIIMCFNTDLGDGVEWMDDPFYPSRFSTYSLKFLTNVVIYSMTH